MQKLLTQKYNQGIFEVFDDKPEIENLLTVHQIHSADVVEIPILDGCKADGIVTSLDQLGDGILAIKTADCLPVLFLSDTHAALVHAGWRGVKDKILIHDKLQHSWNHIFIGPCIHKESFEVQSDFRAEFPESSNFEIKEKRMTFDLVNEAMQQLEQQYPGAKIDNSGVCTFKNNAYNSYRRDKTTKRNWNIFKLN